MKILLTGGLGFVGKTLTKGFLAAGHQVTAVDLAGRSPFALSGYEYVPGDTTRPGLWQQALSSCDCCVNLAGISIFRRWNAYAKKAIYDSRILTTRRVAEAIPQDRPFTLLSTSAAGFYGFHGAEELTEEDGPGSDFLAHVCVDWEREAGAAEEKGARVVRTRFGVVLGKRGGALAAMRRPFSLGLGGPLGSGSQYFPWVHEKDLLRIFLFLLAKTDIRGPVNCTSPLSVTNREFARALGRALRRPAVLPAPATAVRLLLGEFGDSLLHGQRVAPRKLLNAGFTFSYPELSQALGDLLAP
ncbi:MAG: TIGR01777 family oxidoreductase [Thermodesulfobacteriota bacterium]